MKIFAISGLGADQRVFEYLELNHTLIPVNWISPIKNESIVAYAKRLVDDLKLTDETDFGILGISFGGLIAIEISKIVNPKVTIIVSSIETRDELKSIYKFADKIKLIEILPKRLFLPPKFIAHYLFGTKKKKLLNEILKDTDLDFAKWATRELLHWQNQTKLPNLINIVGSKDKLLHSTGKKSIQVNDGEHFMIVDKAKEISQIINSSVQKQLAKIN